MNYKNVKINDISPDAKSAYDYIVSLVRVLYGTEEYPLFYQTVLDVFGQVQPILVDSIAAYFIGCSLKTSIDHQGCSVLCAGAIPAPTSSDIPVCNYLVLMSTYDSTLGYTFTPLNSINSSEYAILFVPEDTGFNDVEMQKFKSYNIANIAIYKTSLDGREYTPLTEGFISLDAVKTRDVSSSAELVNTKKKSFWTKSATQSSQSMMSTGAGIAIGVLLVVIIILLVIVIIENFTDYLPASIYKYDF